MSKKITSSVDLEIGKSFSNMIVDIDNALVSISSGLDDDGNKEYTFKSKVKIYVSQTAFDDNKKEVMIESIFIKSNSVSTFSKDPYKIIETELKKKYTLV